MRLLRIAWGDLRRVSKDYVALFWMLVMPLVFAFILGSVFKSGPSKTNWIAIVDLDGSDLSRLFIDQLEADEYWLEVKGSEDEHHLRHGCWPCGIAIPPDFSEKILRGERLKLQVVKGYGSPDRILDVQSQLTHALVRFTQALALEHISHRRWNDESKEALKQALSRPPLLGVERKGHATLKPPAVGFALSLPGFTVMFVLLMITAAGGETLMRDRIQGQLARLMAAPFSLFEIYAAKILARIVIGVIQAVLLLACGRFIFGISLGFYPVFLAPIIVCLAVFAGSLSMLVGVLCRTEKQVTLAAIFSGVFFAALGGCWWPIEIVPESFKLLAWFTPSYWAMHGFQNVMYFNKSSEVLFLECPILLGSSAVILLVVAPLLRRSR